MSSSRQQPQGDQRSDLFRSLPPPSIMLSGLPSRTTMITDVERVSLMHEALMIVDTHRPRPPQLSVEQQAHITQLVATELGETTPSEQTLANTAYLYGAPHNRQPQPLQQHQLLPPELAAPLIPMGTEPPTPSNTTDPEREGGQDDASPDNAADDADATTPP